MKSIAALLLLAKSGFSAKWDYENNQAFWGDVSSMCSSQDQSPIDVNTLTAIKDPSVCVAAFDWDINLKHDRFKVSNNGHTIALKPIDSAHLALSSNENTIGRFPNYFQPEGSEHDSFCMDSMHFHWGLDDKSGSEHTVNGYQFPLELHFVHYSCGNDNIGSTLGQFGTEKDVLDGILEGVDTHQLGVVGLFFDVVEDQNNPAFDALFDDLTDFDDKDTEQVINGLDLTELIPADIGSAGYYAYEGSLTTPPCTNIVRWHVMNARGYIGKSQMEKFRTLMNNKTGNIQIAPNYRVVQNNVNPLYACTANTNKATSSSSTTKKEELGTDWIVAIIAMATVALLAALSIYQFFRMVQLTNSIESQSNRKASNV